MILIITLSKNVYFNSHAHVERDEFDNDNNASYLNFNSHAHVERDSGQSFLSEMRKHFNSHAHVERDNQTLLSLFLNLISTHTLTWSVTSSTSP